MALSTQKNRTLKIIRIARKVIDQEKKSIEGLRNLIDEKFVKVIDILSSLNDKKVILTGIGKSGIIAKKISSTLMSIGVNSFYIHPIEALHGDIGIISEGDVVIALSSSGSTLETNKFVSIVKKRGVKVIGITNNPNSKLSHLSDIVLNIGVRREACPYNLIPTSSTTAMIALGDAIAISVLSVKGYKRDEFTKNHPGGNIGKLFYIKVKEIMRKGKDNPVIYKEKTVKEAIDIMTLTSLGAVSVINKNGKLIGYFTDGDLRRKIAFIKLNDKIERYMTKNPLCIDENELAIKAAKIINDKKVDNLPVVDEKKRVVGIIDERDLIKEGII
jgi:arabinose-5-phosphate isomerase